MASNPTRLRFALQHQDLPRCGSAKLGYTTKARALDVAEQMMFEGRVHPGCHITPYLCGDCHEWHVWNRQVVPRAAL